MKISRTLSIGAAAVALAASSAAFAGSSNPPVISSDSGSAGSSTLSAVVATYAAPSGTFQQVAGLPGATAVNYRGEQAQQLAFSEGGVDYVMIVTVSNDVVILKA